jgi:hypothetical protein
MVNTKIAAALVAASLVYPAAPAAATFHFMRIVQVYGGAASHPDAQYVVLQMCAGGQNEVGGHTVAFYDATGTLAHSETFLNDVGVGTTQAKILVGTSSAEALFGLAADLEIPAAILTPGGKLCFAPEFGPIDCVGWGNIATPDATIGTPFDAGIGLPPGEALQRDLAIDGLPTVLDCSGLDFDDTNDSLADFDPAAPTPGNNGGVVGVLDTDHIFLHAFEGGVSDGWSAEVP